MCIRDSNNANMASSPHTVIMGPPSHHHQPHNILSSIQGNHPNQTSTLIPELSMHGDNLTMNSQIHSKAFQNNNGRSPNGSNVNNNNNVHNSTANRPNGYIDDPARRLYVMDHEEHKPFKCPVIGCEKTYKNQNGLKYHKIHGHQNQKLQENPDGTFTILDPDSNEPFFDNAGNAKDKPYRCEVCGKRYKNLNGLKYHRGHSTH